MRVDEDIAEGLERIREDKRRKPKYLKIVK